MRAVRKLLGLAALAAVAVGAAMVLRRRTGQRPERVDLYYEDGSMATFEGGAEAVALLGHARDALTAARTV